MFKPLIEFVRRLLCFIGNVLCLSCRKSSLARLRFEFEGGFSATGTDLEIGMNLEQKVVVTVKPTTAHGNPAAIDGNVAFAVDHPELVTINQTGPETAELIGVQGAEIPPEGVSVLVTAVFDADLGAGTTNVTLSGALLVTSPEATGGTIEFADPTDQ